MLGVCVLAISLIFWLRLPLDSLIRYANGNFILVYLLCMAAGWRLLPGIGRGLAGLGVLLCLLVLVALAGEALYALLLAVGYGGYWLWRRQGAGAQQDTILPPS